MKQTPSVVILVDDKLRDLPMAALIAHHLERLGLVAHLEPLEAFKAALAAYRPAMILFNHMLASHLVKYSKRLHELGVLTAVLPNEGIMYEEGERRFNAGRSHSGAHIDQFFCWHRLFKEALLDSGFGPPTEIHVVGPPRFDFYFEPWSRIWHPGRDPQRRRPKLLVATNFGLAVFKELPRQEADKFFSAWVDRIPTYKDYWGAIEIHHRSRERVLEYLQPVLESDRFDVVLRPHPREDKAFYERWLAGLPARVRNNLAIDHQTNITTLILDCDIEISMDRCTTALEAWIAGKPTIELAFERHPILSDDERTALNVQCNDPARLVETIEHELAHPEQAAYREGRQAHLALWCHAPGGHSTQAIAEAIAARIAELGERVGPQLPLKAVDYRKGLKLRLLRALGLPYNWRLLMPLRRLLQPVQSELSYRKIRKAIRPRDVRAMMARLRELAETTEDSKQ